MSETDRPGDQRDTLRGVCRHRGGHERPRPRQSDEGGAGWPCQSTAGRPHRGGGHPVGHLQAENRLKAHSTHKHVNSSVICQIREYFKMEHSDFVVKKMQDMQTYIHVIMCVKYHGGISTENLMIQHYGMNHH